MEGEGEDFLRVAVKIPPPPCGFTTSCPVLLKTCVSSNHGNGSRAAIDFALDSRMVTSMSATILFSIGSVMDRPLYVLLGMGWRYFRLCHVYLRQFCHLVLAILLGRIWSTNTCYFNLRGIAGVKGYPLTADIIYVSVRVWEK